MVFLLSERPLFGWKSGLFVFWGYFGGIMAIEMDESWADAPTNFTLTDNNLTVTLDVAPWRGIIATQGWSSGKWYWEVTVGFQANFISSYSQSIGVCLTTHTKTSFMGSVGGFGWAGHPSSGNGDLFREGLSNNPIGPINTYVATDILSLALDMDNGKLFAAKNGVWENSGDPVAGTGFILSGISGLYYPSCSLIATPSAVTFNFGVAGPTMPIPAGYTMPDYEEPGRTRSSIIGSKSMFMM